jgi:hypothetical protein
MKKLIKDLINGLRDSYYDPANNCTGTRSAGSYSALYSMSASSNSSGNTSY